MSENKRRRFTPEEKSKAVRRRLKGEPPQEIADDIGSSATQVLRWESRFLEAGDLAMTRSSRNRRDWGQMVQWAGVVAVLVMTLVLITRYLGGARQ